MSKYKCLIPPTCTAGGPDFRNDQTGILRSTEFRAAVELIIRFENSCSKPVLSFWCLWLCQRI